MIIGNDFGKDIDNDLGIDFGKDIDRYLFGLGSI
jgi:hypothetical protein